MTSTQPQRLVCPSCSRDDAHLVRRGTYRTSNLIQCRCGTGTEMFHIPNHLYPENERGIVIRDRRTLDLQLRAWDRAADRRVTTRLTRHRS